MPTFTLARPQLARITALLALGLTIFLVLTLGIDAERALDLPPIREYRFLRVAVRPPSIQIPVSLDNSGSVAASFAAALQRVFGALVPGLEREGHARNGANDGSKEAPRRVCKVDPLGNGQDDAPAILEAVGKCGKGGVVRLLEGGTYEVKSVMNMELYDARLELAGATLWFSDALPYWKAHSFRLDYQNQSTAWQISGSEFVVDGGVAGGREENKGLGGIDGRGQAWYSDAAMESNIFGRPISLTLINATRAQVSNFAFVQPQFWATLIWNSTDVAMTNIYINATNTDPRAKPGERWIQNTDGSDTYRSSRILYQDWLVQNGDDCLAFKGNSTQIVARNITCLGGEGITFGSLGQYPDRFDLVEDVLIDGLRAVSSNGETSKHAVYFKNWSGEVRGGGPNGGGGGSGLVRNVTIKNVEFESEIPLNLQSCLPYPEQVQCEPSDFPYENVRWENITGRSLTDVVVDLHCSVKTPCKDWSWTNIDIKAKEGTEGKFVCENVESFTGDVPCHSERTSNA